MNSEDHVSIEGTLLMLDDLTPHVAVPVQAICDGEVIAAVLSDERGRYQFVDLEPGQYKLRCHVLGGYVYYRAADDALRVTDYEEDAGEVLHIEHGKTSRNIDFYFAHFKKGTWKNYNTLDGLPHIRVRSIHHDPDGVMWFDTEGGVSRYDGKEFVNFTREYLPGKIIRITHHDLDGRMWFGTLNNGVYLYDGKTFTNFTTEDGLAGNRINAIHHDPDGTMWFMMWGGGVSRYDGKEFVNFIAEDGLPKDGLLSNAVFAIHRDPDGTMWFGTGIDGIIRYDGKEFVNFTTEDGLLSNAVFAIHRDPDGTMWFGTGNPLETEGGLSKYDGKEFVNFTAEDGLPSSAVFTIHRDPDGVMWLGTFSGVSRYDGKAFVNFTTEDGLAGNAVDAIHRDSDGTMWFGAFETGGGSGGVSRYDEKTFVDLTAKDGLADDFVRAIHRDPDGAIWFGTWGSGVSRYDGKEFFNFTTEDGLADNYVTAIHSDPDGMIWFGSWVSGGVSRYDGREFINFTTEDGLAGNRVRDICHDPDGVIWFAIQVGGVSRYDGKEFINFTTDDGLADNIVWAVHSDPDGVMWFGTEVGGVSRYDGKDFVNFTTEDGLAGNYVTAIHSSPDGVMWFGTQGGGISRYDGKEFVNFTPEDGLANSFVNTIHRDPDGAMWFGTCGGVACYDGVAWTSLDKRDGLAGNWVCSIRQDADGSLWFATDGGVTRYRRSTTQPKVRIISVTTDQTYSEVAAVPAFTPDTRVTIEYGALDFKTVPEKQQYRCRIQAFGKSLSKKEMDTDWRKPTKATSFDLIFNEPGTYTFQVQAIDRDLNYSEPVSMELEVIADPRNHKIAQLESDLEKRNQELEQANVELEEANVELQRLSSFKSELLSVVSHELRTPLTSIDGFTRLISERFLTDELIEDCNEKTRPTIQRAKDRIGIVQENTSRLSRLINDLLDFSRIERGRELEMSLARMELSGVIENVISTYQSPAAEKGLSLRYGGDVPLHADQLVVYGDADRLNQALSNLVGNAVKFTPVGGEITIGAHKMDGKIQLTVKDTGVGIPEEQLATIFEPFEQAGGVDSRRSGTGLGLSIVKYIIIRHDGTIHVESEEGAGSTFIIMLSEYTPEATTRRGLQRILIVDDDYDILRLLQEGLSEYPNTHIITATSSKDAFQILEQQSCDVMITDVRMPGDLSGLELASQVREKYPDLKVFVMTNTPDEKDRVIQVEADWIDKATPNLIHYIARKVGRR